VRLKFRQQFKQQRLQMIALQLHNMSDNFLRGLLARAGISNEISKAVEEKTRKISEEKEQWAQLQASDITKKIINEVLADMKAQEAKKQAAQKPGKIILTGDE
jgi:6-phosphogluconate dehydrogenase (decarboxylating)